jgi:hypothetical protein
MRAWLVAALLLGLPSKGLAGELVVNDVPVGKVELTVQGLDGVRLERCDAVAFGPGGTVRVSCPGYDLRATLVSPSPAPAAVPAGATKTERGWWLSVSGASGAGGVALEIYLDGKFLRGVKAAESLDAVNVTDRLGPGRHTLVVSARSGAAGMERLVRVGTGAAGVEAATVELRVGPADAGTPRAVGFVVPGE